VLGTIVGGTILASIAVARLSDRFGRRRSYIVLYIALAVSGTVFALSGNLFLLLLVALTGTLSTDIVDNGPFTSLEQSMLAAQLSRRKITRSFGLYNAVATLAGSLDAMAADDPTLFRRFYPGVPTNQRFFLLFVPVALASVLVAWRLSSSVAAPRTGTARSDPGRLGESRSTIIRLASLFAVDAFGGGFIVQAFVAYWFSVKFGTSIGTLGIMFFVIGILQCVSYLVAIRLAERFGLLATMVFTHLPSNLLLAAIAFAPNFPVAVALLFLRSLLSQMDVPTG
jgi:predicted MFS family arabinose efflux permease